MALDTDQKSREALGGRNGEGQGRGNEADRKRNLEQEHGHCLLFEGVLTGAPCLNLSCLHVLATRCTVFSAENENDACERAMNISTGKTMLTDGNAMVGRLVV